jgi:hypothetical protein
LAANAAYEEFLLDTDDEEELCVSHYDQDDGVEADDEGVEADGARVESDNDDPESDTPAADEKDPELEYEVVSTELGDGGCVTGGSRIKTRSVTTSSTTGSTLSHNPPFLSSLPSTLYPNIYQAKPPY